MNVIVFACLCAAFAALHPHGHGDLSSPSCASGCHGAAATGAWNSSAPFGALDVAGRERTNLSLQLHLRVTPRCTASGHYIVRDAQGRILHTVLLVGAWAADRFDLQAVARGGRPAAGRLTVFVGADGATMQVTAISSSSDGDDAADPDDVRAFRATVYRTAAEPLPPPTRLPNVLFLFVDDLGYADFNVAAFNGRTNVKTPNVAKLATQGMTMTSFYAGANVCTPSRAALLSGLFPVRVGMENNNFRVLISTGMRAGLQTSTTLISEMLQDAGYRTGMVGKWHVGVGGQRLNANPNVTDDSLMPWNRGFESANYIYPLGNGAGCSREAQGSVPCSGSQVWIGRQLAEQPWRQDNTTALLTREAVAFLQQSASDPRPWFFYLAYPQVHTPTFASSYFRGKSQAGPYGDMIEEVDWSVGVVLAELDRLGLANDTLVWWSSDNGGALEAWTGPSVAVPTTPAAEAPQNHWKGGKGQTWEGGHRVPSIVRWPGYVAPNSTTAAVATNADWFPTLAQLAGVSRDTVLRQRTDGHSLVPLFSGAPSRHDFLPYFCGQTLMAGRVGNYKVHWATQNFLRQNGSATLASECGGTGECCPRTCTPEVDLGCVPEASCLCANSAAGAFVTYWGPTTGVRAFTRPLILDLRINWREDVSGCVAGDTPDYGACTHAGVLKPDTDALYTHILHIALLGRQRYLRGNDIVSQLGIDALACLGTNYNASSTSADCTNEFNCVNQTSRQTCCCSKCLECVQRYPCAAQPTPISSASPYPNAFALQFPPVFEFTNASSAVFADYWCGTLQTDPSFPASLIPSAKAFQCAEHGVYCT